MPALNIVKLYVENGYYHVYNRGVEKRDIFLDEQDYVVFLRFLKEYLLPPSHPDLIALQGINPRRKPKNFHEEIVLYAYCLMPNHFHLFVKQVTLTGLKEFMRAVATNYSMYFNHKYHRVGPLFQGNYKASLILDDIYFLHITRYIHANPGDLARVGPLQEYQWSSYKFYLKGEGPTWLEVKEIANMFRSSGTLFPNDILSYQSFVEGYDGNDEELLGRMRLED